MDSWILSSPFRLCGALLALAAAPALAGVAGTGTATVKVDFVAQKLGVTATFDDGARDLQGVNLGTLAPFAATGCLADQRRRAHGRVVHGAVHRRREQLPGGW